MKEKPLISVVIPAFNHAAFLGDALDSIQAQSWSGPLEVIVVDDGSSDETAALAKDHPLAPLVISQKNRGAAGARNRGIEASRGDWIAFLDADDRWLSTRLEEQLNLLLPLRRPALSFSRYRRVRLDGPPLIGAVDHPSRKLRPSFSKLLNQNFIGTSTVLVHRECLRRCGGFPEAKTLRKGQDYALWLRITSLFPLVYLPFLTVLYGVHPGNRVGVDPVEHHRAGLEALRDFAQWEPRQIRSLPFPSFKTRIAIRQARFFTEALQRPDRFFRRAGKPPES